MPTTFRRRLRVAGACALRALFLTPLCILAAQQPPVIALKPADATLDEEFNSIRSVRELADGRLLVTDSRDRRVVVADFGSRVVRVIGRQGSGPGEYSAPQALTALGSDSTIVPGGDDGRWLLLEKDRIVETITREGPMMSTIGTAIVGADGRGKILGVPFNFEALRRHTREQVSGVFTITPDSSALVIGDRSTGHVDTIARLSQRNGRRSKATPRFGSRDVVWLHLTPVDGSEQGLMFLDGWISIARKNPYRVDWRSADGRWLLGQPIPDAPMAVTDAEKRFAIRRSFPSGDKAPFEPEDYPPWPRFLAPFLDRSILPAPDGRLVIWRTPSVTTPGNVYDFIDRAGKLSGRFRLPPNETIAGFGAKSVYVVVTDDDDVQRIRRHPWP